MYDFSDPLTILLVLFVIFMSTAIHELMHAYVAMQLGDDLAHSRGRISLNPLKHIDPFLTVILPLVLMLLGSQPILAAKPVPINVSRLKGGENGLALVGLAGPLTNLAIACIAALILRANGLIVSGWGLTMVLYFFYINVGLFVFNMIPFPPLDGSRLLYAFAPEPLQKLMYKIERAGIMAIVLFILILFPVISPVISHTIQSLYSFILG